MMASTEDDQEKLHDKLDGRVSNSTAFAVSDLKRSFMFQQLQVR